ncbi:MAG: AraC family transcriptional regulator [Candidatus Sulfobium sp.]|jgi:AraC-like DNA-binding protein
MEGMLAKETNEGGNMSAVLSGLRVNIARLADKDGSNETAVPGLTLYMKTGTTRPHSGMYPPCICVAVQGAKRAVLGSNEYVYDARHYLVTPINLPTVVQILEASPEKPYLGLVLDLDLRTLAELMVDSALPSPQTQQQGHAMATGRLTPELLDAFKRLVDLLDNPGDIPILAPIIKREIFYRMLVGEQGARLRQMATAGSQGNRIAQAIDWLKGHYAQPLRIDDLAAQVNMSASTFHHHFRALTAMSPLQYQKWLRLNEARRLMLSENEDAAAAAFQVGYESPSQFSREYSRMFGNSPSRDITNLRQTAVTEVS